MKHPLLLSGILLMSLYWAGPTFAELSGDEILIKSDAVFESPTAIMDVTMTTTNADNTQTSQMVVYSKKDASGVKRTLIKYVSPPEDRGTLFLSLGSAEQIWMYLPKINKTIRISGNMVKQSMMNSDFSYEDLMDRSKLSDDYTAQFIGNETVSDGDGDTDCYVLDLKAKKGSAHYRQMKLWVSRDRFVPIREDFYSGSGKLIKTAYQSNIVKIHGRWVPTTITFRDLEQKNHQTVLTMTQIRFMVPIPERYFTVEYLAKTK